jgi:D-lactate dehydrogenase (cytochrome)
MSEAQKPEGGSIKHDVSVPVHAIPAFIAAADAAVAALVPGARPVPFGHFGDGNIHYNISQPVGMDKQAFLERWEEVSQVVHGIVLAHEGSISAEHGIGRLKRDMLRATKSAVELDLMRALKHTLDPVGILNPGKLI